MRQASRRSWRIGQSESVQVVFIVYRNALQADALKLVAQKLQSSLAEDGLAVYEDDGDDPCSLWRGRSPPARKTPARSSRSSSRPGRSRRRPRRLLVQTGVAVVDDQAPKPQRSLFSWAEFYGRGAGRAAEAPAARRRLPRAPCASGRLSEDRRPGWWASGADRPQGGGRHNLPGVISSLGPPLHWRGGVTPTVGVRSCSGERRGHRHGWGSGRVPA